MFEPRGGWFIYGKTTGGRVFSSAYDFEPTEAQRLAFARSAGIPPANVMGSNRHRRRHRWRRWVALI